VTHASIIRRHHRSPPGTVNRLDCQNRAALLMMHDHIRTWPLLVPLQSMDDTTYDRLSRTNAAITGWDIK
jgi:hypothetical protein